MTYHAFCMPQASTKGQLIAVAVVTMNRIISSTALLQKTKLAQLINPTNYKYTAT